MQYIIFHGSYGTPDENWIPYMKRSLEALGHTVLTPAFPVDSWDNVSNLGLHAASSIENLDNWMRTFDEIYPILDSAKGITFITHSLASVFVLHIIEKYKFTLDCALFVCPFLGKLNRDWQIDHVNASFYKRDFDFQILQKHLPSSYSLYTDNDPYVDPVYAHEFADAIKSSEIEVTGGGHLNTRAGYSTFPLLLELCKTRLGIAPHDETIHSSMN